MLTSLFFPPHSTLPTLTPPPDPSLQHHLIGWLLKLVTTCLTFDFIGTSHDESSDDLAVVQIPAVWKSVFLDSTTLQLFFGLYQGLPPEVAAKVG